MRQQFRVSWALAALGILIFSQSCATVSGPRIAERKPASNNTFTMTGSSLVYEYERGKVDFATTELLDIYDNGVIDLLRSPDPQVRQLLEQIPFEGEFYVVVMNGHKSPTSLIQINDKYHFAKDYTYRSRQFAAGLDVPFQKYSFTSKKGATTLKSLKLHVLKGAYDEGTLVSTNQICVEKNKPGPRGEYRNGALTIQFIGTDLTTFNPITSGAGKKAKLLAEFSVFRESGLAKCK